MHLLAKVERVQPGPPTSAAAWAGGGPAGGVADGRGEGGGEAGHLCRYYV